MVEDVYDQNIPTMAFWSIASSPGHVDIQHGELKWHKIQLGPIRRFTWAEPTNSAFLIYIFLLIFARYMGLAQQFGLLIFWAVAFYSIFIFQFKTLYIQTGPTSQMGPTCQFHLSNRSHMSEMYKLDRL